MKLLVLVPLIFLAACSVAAPGATPTESPKAGEAPERTGPGTHQLSLGERKFLLHAPPSYTDSASWPVVFVFHGSPSTPEAVQGASDFDTVADKGGFLVVYPANRGRWSPEDDGFVTELVEHVRQVWHADPKRTFVSGFSAGAEYTYHLAQALPGKFGAAAPVSGVLAGEAKLTPENHISLITFQGTEDRAADAFPTTNASWKRAAGCGEAKVTTITNEGRKAHQYLESCAAGSEHAVYTMVGMGHFWPMGPKTSNALAASEVIWEFFQKHPLA